MPSITNGLSMIQDESSQYVPASTWMRLHGGADARLVQIVSRGCWLPVKGSSGGFLTITILPIRSVRLGRSARSKIPQADC